MRQLPGSTPPATPRRHAVAVVVLALFCSSVSFAPAPHPPGTAGDPVASSALVPGLPETTDRAGARADRGRGTDAPQQAAPAPLGQVSVQQPRVRVDEAPQGALETALGVEGVSFATVIAVAEVGLAEPGGQRTPVRVAMVDPAGFRVLTPQVTADALDLWERVGSGEAVFTHEHAARLLLQLGTHVPVGDQQTFRVGGIATITTPPVADAIVNVATGERLGLTGAPRSLLVALTPEAQARPDTVARALERELGAPAQVIADPRSPHTFALDGLTTPENVWDRLAMCESSGNWHINTGNGYYGGLQFLPESWYLVGGTGMPHEASREEQIARAERLRAIQGWEAWPVCSILLGLRPGPLPERYRPGGADAGAEAEPEPAGAPPPPADEPPQEPPPEGGGTDAPEGDTPPEDDPSVEEGISPLS